LSDGEEYVPYQNLLNVPCQKRISITKGGAVLYRLVSKNIQGEYSMIQKLVINLDVNDIEVELRDEIVKDAYKC